MGSAPSATPQPFEPGAVVGGKYKLRRRLAAGGAGEVWVARNEATRAKVALKVLRRGTTATLDAVERFRQEARIGGMLSHRNIVRVFDLIEQKDGTLVLVMELLAGETLASYIKRRGALPPREAVAICLPILAGLRHAHEQKVLHRDISPRNIFLVVEPDGHVVPKLVDFGLAKAPSWEFKTVEGSVLGTPSYMSPEQIRAEPNLDARTDVYGIGAVLYEMLTGSAPYRGPNPMATLVASLEKGDPPRRNIDDNLWAVVKSALAKPRDERPADAQAFAAMLVAAVSGTGVSLAAELNHTSAVMVGDEIHNELAEEQDGDAKDGVSYVQLTPGVATAFGPGVPKGSRAPPPKMAVPIAAIISLAVVATIAIVAIAAVATRGSGTPAAASTPLVATAAGAVREAEPRAPAPSAEIAAPVPTPSAAPPRPTVVPASAPSPPPPSPPRAVATTPGF